MRNTKEKMMAVIMTALFISPASTLHAIDAGIPSTTAREYYPTNTDGRFLIKVQLWGDAPLSGIHHVPDNSTLLDLLGFAGGPSGRLSNAKVFLKRRKYSLLEGKTESDAGAHQPVQWQTLELDGTELLEKASVKNYALASGDIVYLEVEKERDTFVRDVTIVAAITGILSTILVSYFLIQDKKK